jgi:GTP pyrophosphokinase
VLDFAFGIHSGLGARCSGGLVNGKAVKINEKLKTGDTVEILTSKNQRPNRDWLGWVVTSKARSKIKLELDAEERKRATEGREILERRLRNWKLELPDDMQSEYMKAHGYKSVMPFMAAIADGTLDVNDIKAFIQEKASGSREEVQAQDHKRFIPVTDSGEDILVLNAKDVKGLDYKMAACCNPVFGDDVFGFVTRSAGIKIHRMSCPNAARLLERYPYRIQKVVWQDTATAGSFLATLVVTSEPEHSVLSSIMTVTGQFRASIRSLNVAENHRNGTFEITIRLFVPSSLELDKVISQISAIRQVSRVKRL